MLRTFHTSLLYCILLGVLACKKDPLPSPDAVFPNKRTVIVYMAANNNLRAEALNSINQMERAAEKLDGNLLVYFKASGQRSDLLKIKYDLSDRIKSDTLKSYGDENSSDPLFMKQVLADAQALEPSGSYGLVLWSHATSWAPPSGIMLKSFGLDRGYEMDIKDLKAALPDNLTYLLFDACSMASIEVIYELKDKARYILASPTETLAESYPYEKITPYLFGDANDLKKVGQQFVEHYDGLNGLYRSATVSLIDTRELTELALRTKRLLANQVSFMPNFNRSQVQRLDFDPDARMPAYDFMDFLNKNFSASAYQPVADQLQKTVIYKAHTVEFTGQPIHVFSGLSCYIPFGNDTFREYYQTLQWCRDSGFNELFDKSSK